MKYILSHGKGFNFVLLCVLVIIFLTQWGRFLKALDTTTGLNSQITLKSLLR